MFQKLNFPSILIWVLQSIVLILLRLGRVAFITLIERKLLGLSQIRLGPNKFLFAGVVQPILDGLKLLRKQKMIVYTREKPLFVLCPIILFGVFVIVWGWILPWEGSFFNLKYSSLLLFSLLGAIAYAVLLTGWRRINRFSKLGSLRRILQSLSFEVRLVLLFIRVLSFLEGFSLKREIKQGWESLSLWLVLFLLLSLIETNRAPFDLLEGESELVRGFNIEIGAVFFVFLFLREYGIVIVLRIIASSLIRGCLRSIYLCFVVFILIIRSCFPRVRYDIIIEVIWPDRKSVV